MSAGSGTAGLRVRLDEVKGLLKPKQFYDSTIFARDERFYNTTSFLMSVT